MSAIRLILLDSHSNGGTFYPGQAITGKIECNFNTEKNVTAVLLKFKGKGYTEWEESERYYEQETEEYKYKTVRYTGKESYLNTRVTLLEASGGSSKIISAGKHTYPFSYILPTRLPSSFSGTYGSIRYTVQAIVSRSWKSNFTTAKRVLHVISRLDLNSFPKLREPVAISFDETMYSCCCYSAGQLTFNMSLPATGFIPGQDVSIGLYVNNMTNVNVESLKFKIVKKTTFTTKNPTRATKQLTTDISRCVERGIGAHAEKSWTATLNIPTNREYPNFRACGLFHVSYKLKTTVLLPFPHSNLEYKTPITIGGIPLTGISTTFEADPPPQPPPEEDTSL